MKKLPKIIGHRGCAGYAPENTIPGIHTAADMGVEWVELDIKLTKDDIPIIFHDDTLERTTNGSGSVKNCTYDDLKDYDVGTWFSDSFMDTRIPTLEQALDAIIARDLGLNLEIKPCEGREKETAEIALDILSTIWDNHDSLLISSFSHISMETALDMAPDWQRGFLLHEEWPDNWKEMAEYLSPTTININGNHITEEQIELLLPLGKPLLAYTINSGKDALHLQNKGVRGFFSDVPDVLQDSLITVH